YGAAGRAILAARRGESDSPGYALTHGELEAGASGAAAPLLGVLGIEGSVGVVMLTDTIPERVGPRVMEAAKEVADALR
ncbi:IclR family transcriptional regulator, partial [Streptomyces sp. URMC 127]